MSMMLLMLMGVSAVQASDAPMVDYVVAVVDKVVITHSELLQESQIAMVQRHGEAAARELNADNEFFAIFRQYLVSQHLIGAQARRLGAADVSAADMHRARRAFIGLFDSRNGYRNFMRAHNISVSFLETVLRRQLRNERYVEERMRLRLLRDAEGDTENKQALYRQELTTWLSELRAASEITLLDESGRVQEWRLGEALPALP